MWASDERENVSLLPSFLPIPLAASSQTADSSATVHWLMVTTMTMLAGAEAKRRFKDFAAKSSLTHSLASFLLRAVLAAKCTVLGRPRPTLPQVPSLSSSTSSSHSSCSRREDGGEGEGVVAD